MIKGSQKRFSSSLPNGKMFLLEHLEEKILLCDAAHEDCLKKGKLLDSLKCLEASCSLRVDRHDQHGIGIEDVDRGYQALVTEYNTTAMLSLQVIRRS